MRIYEEKIIWCSSLICCNRMKHSDTDLPFPLSCAIQKVLFCFLFFCLLSGSAERRTMNLVKNYEDQKIPLRSPPSPQPHPHQKEEEEEEEEEEESKRPKSRSEGRACLKRRMATTRKLHTLGEWWSESLGTRSVKHRHYKQKQQQKLLHLAMAMFRQLGHTTATTHLWEVHSHHPPLFWTQRSRSVRMRMRKTLFRLSQHGLVLILKTLFRLSQHGLVLILKTLFRLSQHGLVLILKTLFRLSQHGLVLILIRLSSRTSLSSCTSLSSSDLQGEETVTWCG